MDDKYLAFLEEDDENSRAFRARRLARLVEEFGEPRSLIIPGGFIALGAFEEARQAYLHGLDIATVLLSQTALEHMLAGLLRQTGRNGRWTFGTMLALAKADGLISDAEFDLFDRLRRMRNPYSHAKKPLADGTLLSRMADGNGPYELMEEDATLAITALLRLLQRHPFSQG